MATTRSGFFEVNQNKGIRWNAAKAFLRPALRRANLRLLIQAHTDRLLIEGARCTGLRFRWQGRSFAATARAGVLLAAGAINSPKLLELSGIGRGELLQQLGISVVHESRGVGENLQDHLQIRTVYQVSNAKTLNTVANSWIGKATMAAEYALLRRGPLSMAPSQFGMFTKSDPALATPDLEYHVQPLSTNRLGEPLHPFPAITVSVCNLRPESRGSCHIAAPDLDRQPSIRPNYLSTEGDRAVALRAVRQARRIMTAKVLRRYQPQEILPGTKVETNAELLREIGNIATTIFHPVGTCRMGPAEDAVVDPQLRVHGVEGLRVVDASIMPRIVSGNTASPVIMIAEKAADMIQAEWTQR